MFFSFYKKIQTRDCKTYINNLRIFEVNLDYYERIWENQDIKEIRNNYIYILFNRGKEELLKLNKICKEAKEYIDMIEKANEDYCSLYSYEEDQKRIANSLRIEAREEGFKDGITQGIEQGTLLGSNNTRLAIINNMLDKGLSYEEISDLTNISIEEIKILKDANK